MSESEPELTDLFWKNQGRLMDSGAIQTSKSGLEPDEPSLSEFIESDLIIGGLNRATAMRIAETLSNRLDQESAGRVADSRGSTEGLMATRSIRSNAPGKNGFNVVVGQNSEGKYTVQAQSEKELAKDRLAEGVRIINRAYIHVLNNEDLDEIDGVDETTEESITSVTVPVESPGRLGRLLKRQERDLEAEQKAVANRQAMWYLKLFKVEDAETVHTGNLRELWESRNGDPIAMMDLFLYEVADRQSPPINDKYPRLSLLNLQEAAAEKKSPLDLRHEQEKTAIETLVNIGFKRKDVEQRFQFSPTEREKLQLRFAAWLLEQPDLALCRRDLEIRLRDGQNLPNHEIFQPLFAYTRNAYHQHVYEDRQRLYKMNKKSHADAFRSKKLFLETIYLMQMSIFYGADIDKHLEPEK